MAQFARRNKENSSGAAAFVGPKSMGIYESFRRMQSVADKGGAGFFGGGGGGGGAKGVTRKL